MPPGSNITVEISTNYAAIGHCYTCQPDRYYPQPLVQLAQQWTALPADFLTAHRPYDINSGWTPAPATSQAGVPNAPVFNVTPQTISTGLLLFMAALKSEDFRNWIGSDNVKWLQNQGHDALVKKAEVREFLALARPFTSPAPHSWQSLFFPVAVDGTVQQARLFVKRDRKQGNKQDGKGGEDTRFVVEVDLSQLGELQMDGFVRKRENEVQFDMMIRSLTPLSE